MFVGVSLADAETEDEPAIQDGVSQVEATARIQTIEGEADEIQRRRRGQFEFGGGFDRASEPLRQIDVAADMVLEAFDAIVTNHEPEFEGAEATTQRDLPIAVIYNGAGLRGAIAQVFGKHAYLFPAV